MLPPTKKNRRPLLRHVKPSEEFVLPLLVTEEIFTCFLKNEAIESKNNKKGWHKHTAMQHTLLFSRDCAGAK